MLRKCGNSINYDNFPIGHKKTLVTKDCQIVTKL